MHLWVNDYIGLPWVAYARGPSAFDCAGVVIEVLAKHYNQRTLPSFLNVITDDYRGITAAVEAEKKTGLWRQVAEPEDGAVALFYIRRNGDEYVRHLGVYVDIDGGGILHSAEKQQCTFDPVSRLQRLFVRTEFYVHV